MIWIAIVGIFVVGFIHHVFFKEDNDESTAKDLNINWDWKRKPFDPDTYKPSSLHRDKYENDEDE